MDAFNSGLIDLLGGTTAVSDLTEAPMSTVHHLRRKMSPSRLNHLRRVAHMSGLSSEVTALADRLGVELPPLPLASEASCGKVGEISGAVSA